MNKQNNPGTLYVVATPIGNLEDITRRAARILGEVDIIACEDTRHTRKLLSHLGIQRATLTSYYREQERTGTQKILRKLRSGLDVALVSDAGTPAVSDPGSILVRGARDAGIPVVPVPGPSALIAAVSAAGLEQTGFFFGGFLPARQGGRTKLLKSLARLPCALVFYESPRRVRQSIRDCLDTLGNRQALLFREISKVHEECLPGDLSTLLDQITGNIRGELVLIIHPATRESAKPDNLADLLAWHRERGLSLKDAVKTVSDDLDLARNLVYKEALNLWNSS